jgi:hypothetical protein
MIDYKNMSYKDIQHGSYNHSYYSKGKRKQKVTTYQTHVKTKIGEFELGEWVGIALKAIEAHGDSELLEHMREYVRAFPWLSEQNAIGLNISQFELEAIELCIGQIYNNPYWVGFLPFNKKFRPEYLKGFSTVSIITECCKERGPGEVTREQIRGGEVSCPFCGRFSRFEEV